MLNAVSGGLNPQHERFALIYQELKIVARSKLRKQAVSHRFDTTGLVHEAYLKLQSRDSQTEWKNRRHFYATAALAMRQLLVDQARKELTDKHGKGQRAITLDEQLAKPSPEVTDVIALDGALEQLHRLDAALAKLVELRFFLGLSVDEVAELTGLSKRTLARNWQKARAFLHAQLDDD